MQVWDLQQGKCMRTLTGHSQPVQKLHADGQRLFSIGGRSLRVWDLTTFVCVHVIHLPRDNGTISALAINPGRMLYIAGQVRTLLQKISFRNLQDDCHSGTLLHPVCWGPLGTLYCFGGSAGPSLRQCAAAAAQDATIKGFLPSNEALQQPSDGHMLPLGALAQRGVPDVASSAADAHCSTVHALAMCRGLLCSAGGDAMIRVWDAATLKLHRSASAHILQLAWRDA